MTNIISAPLPPIPSARASETSLIKDAAVQLEASFIAEMLKASGAGKTPQGFGGGSGEDQFSSFLRDLQAREIALAGGLGLAVHFEHALMAKS